MFTFASLSTIMHCTAFCALQYNVQLRTALVTNLLHCFAKQSLYYNHHHKYLQLQLVFVIFQNILQIGFLQPWASFFSLIGGVFSLLHQSNIVTCSKLCLPNQKQSQQKVESSSFVKKFHVEALGPLGNKTGATLGGHLKALSNLHQPAEEASFAQTLQVLSPILMWETTDFDLSLSLANEIFNTSAVKAKSGQTSDSSLTIGLTLKGGFWVKLTTWTPWVMSSVMYSGIW